MLHNIHSCAAPVRRHPSPPHRHLRSDRKAHKLRQQPAAGPSRGTPGAPVRGKQPLAAKKHTNGPAIPIEKKEKTIYIYIIYIYVDIVIRHNKTKKVTKQVEVAGRSSLFLSSLYIQCIGNITRIGIL